MNKLYLRKENEKIVLFLEDSKLTIFNLSVYLEVVDKFNSKKYSFLESFNNKYNDVKNNDMNDRYLYLFNFALVNNIVNYIIDICKEKNISEIIFDDEIQKINKPIVHFSKKLSITDLLGDIIICLINSDEYLCGNIKIDYGKNIVTNYESDEIISIDNIFGYISSDVKKFIEKLEVDLIAFHYIKRDLKDENDRYILPVYVDEDVLIKKGITNYNEYLLNWMSLAYLKMVTKIHDHFIDYYELDFEKGLVYDDLMIAILYLTEASICPYPKGLAKSIEVGRETAGKCYFINGIVSPVSLMQELAIILQIKDVFNIVPKVFKSKH